MGIVTQKSNDYFFISLKNPLKNYDYFATRYRPTQKNKDYFVTRHLLPQKVFINSLLVTVPKKK
jgi:hypothetical protein